MGRRRFERWIRYSGGHRTLANEDTPPDAAQTAARQGQNLHQGNKDGMDSEGGQGGSQEARDNSLVV